MYQSNSGTKMNAFYKKVEKDEYYMVGDNRDNSADSRFWGSVSYKLVIGQPWFIYFSWDTEKKSIRWDRLGTFIDDLQLEEPRY
jgi:signal peptidase I